MLAQHPDQYRVAPRCDIPGCDGYTRPELYRLRVGANEGRPVCRCEGVGGAWFEGEAGLSNSPHRYGSAGCVHYQPVISDEDFAPGGGESDDEAPF